MTFTHSLSPIIFSIGPLALRWYSLVYIAGFLLGYWLLHRFVAQGRITHLDKEGVESFMVWLIIGSIVSARLIYAIVYNPTYFLAEPWKILFVWEGGLSFHGGLLGAIVASWWFCKKRKVSFFALGDLLVLPLSLMLVLGRFANFINGELVGRVTDVSWCINYPNNPSIEGCRHPSQFYEAGKNLLTFLILVPLYVQESIRKRLKEGTLFWLFFILYGIGRFLTDFYRAPDPTDPIWGGILLGQWLSLLMAAVGVAGLLWLYAKPKRREK